MAYSLRHGYEVRSYKWCFKADNGEWVSHSFRFGLTKMRQRMGASRRVPCDL
jgi:hypothetical protein